MSHMTATKNNIIFKHFQASDLISQVIVADAVTNAKSVTTSKFLRKVMKEIPFKTKPVQVDGRSEFIKDFEQECLNQNVSLYVLPPKRTQFN